MKPKFNLADKIQVRSPAANGKGASTEGSHMVTGVKVGGEFIVPPGARISVTDLSTGLDYFVPRSWCKLVDPETDLPLEEETRDEIVS